MPPAETPADPIARLAAAHQSAPDDELLAHIEAIPPLADESDSCWSRDDYWQSVAYLYLALARLARSRGLRRAMRPLLERAPYGDPGQITCEFHDEFKGMYAGDAAGLADEYLALARSERLGTRMSAISGLTELDDPRAKAVFEDSVRTDPPEIREIAAMGLERLANPKAIADEAAKWKALTEADRQEELARRLAFDAALTDRRCAHCGRPLPSYRKTCRYCKASAKAAE